VARRLARVHKEILRAILSKAKEENAKITERAIYYRIERVRREFGKAISRRTAANLLASRMGIDVYRILKDLGELTELRDLVKITPKPVSTSTSIKTREEEKPMTIRKRIVETYGLPPDLTKEAQRMANVYPVVYVFENTIRYIVKSTLENKYGTDWWFHENVVSNGIRREARKRKEQEHHNRWHSERGSHDIFYTDFGDLSSIISANWSSFKSLFRDLRWIQVRMEEIELSRNIIAHNNPLPSREVDRIKMYYMDLLRQLGKQNAANES
jgi:hypothetical protein